MEAKAEEEVISKDFKMIEEEVVEFSKRWGISKITRSNLIHTIDNTIGVMTKDNLAEEAQLEEVD